MRLPPLSSGGTTFPSFGVIIAKGKDCEAYSVSLGNCTFDGMLCCESTEHCHDIPDGNVCIIETHCKNQTTSWTCTVKPGR